MRVAVLGAGKMGSFHAETLHEHPYVSELLIYDVDRVRGRHVAQPLGVAVADSLESVLDGRLDAAVIATPASTHAGLINRCLRAGIPTFCEKPIALELGETREVVEHVESSGGVLQIGFQRRFDAGYRTGREKIRAGSLGRIYSFYMASRDPEPPPPAYIETSGGIFRDLHIHDFDIVRWLFGQEVDEVYATGTVLGCELFRQYDDIDTSAITVRTVDGTLGVLTGARQNGAGYDIRVDVFGARDSLTIRDRAHPNFISRFGDAYRAELEHFLRLARGEAENPCAAIDAFEALRIAAAAERSRKERRPVRLEEVN